MYVPDCISDLKLSHCCCCGVCHRALKNTYATLAQAGTSRDMIDNMATFSEFNELMGVADRIQTEERLTRREGEKLVVRVRAPTKPV